MTAPADAEFTHALAMAAKQASCAMQFASEPGVWPSFAAWAEQMVPGVTWGEADRVALAENAMVMGKLGAHLDG